MFVRCIMLGFAFIGIKSQMFGVASGSCSGVMKDQDPWQFPLLFHSPAGTFQLGHALCDLAALSIFLPGCVAALWSQSRAIRGTVTQRINGLV